jgi:hypothetical protein
MWDPQAPTVQYIVVHWITFELPSRRLHLLAQYDERSPLSFEFLLQWLASFKYAARYRHLKIQPVIE